MKVDLSKAKRKINGVWFTLHYVISSKVKAEASARAWRKSKGGAARVLAYKFGTKNLWAVWVRL